MARTFAHSSAAGLLLAAFMGTAALAQAPAAPPAPPPPPASTRAPAAGTWLETDTEIRLQLDYHVPDAALAKFIPAGFEPNVATQGAAARANIRVIFIDRIGVTGPDNRALGSGMSRLVYLAVPVRELSSNTTAQMIIGGIVSDPADAPGPFGNYIAASSHSMSRLVEAGADGVTGEEHWAFEAATGEHFSFSTEYTRAPVNRAIPDTRFFSARNPGFYQIFRINQGLDIAWNVTTGADRGREYEWSMGGGAYAELFDGTEELLSIDVVSWYEREVYQQ